jgi:hypothetical protein
MKAFFKEAFNHEYLVLMTQCAGAIVVAAVATTICAAVLGGGSKK